jgi:hypothetical protein
MDYLKKLLTHTGGKIKRQEVMNANFKERSFRRLLIKNYKDYKIQVDDYAEVYLLGLNINSDLAFSINNPEKIFLYNKTINLVNAPYKVYASDVDYNPLKNEFVRAFWESFSDKIKTLQLSENESIFFYNNYISFALNPTRNLIQILDDMIDLVSSHVRVFTKTNIISSKNLPDNLRLLLPLMKKWGITDDVEREQLIEKTGEKQKKKLISAVDPLMKEINEFLDSFKEQPLSEEAMLLGNLAELVSELKTGSVSK